MSPRLAFVSLWDASNPNAESGYAFSMRQQLQKQFDVIDLFPLGLPREQFWYPARAAYKLAGQYYNPMREPSILKALAGRIERALGGIKPDIVFAPSSVPMSYLETQYPLAFATDQLFCDFVDNYIVRPAARFRRLGNSQEARALAHAARVSYPSDWAARSASEYYGTNAEKITVIPWGANLPEEIADADVDAAITKRPFHRCHLVFVGRDWQRKGGDTLVAIVSALNRLGFPTRGTIIGADPGGLPADRFTVHPYLDKARADHFKLFSSIMLGAHFLVLPARAEAFGQVLCEAMAFGVPVIGSTVGGIPTIIRDGETGFLRAADAPVAQFAEVIRNSLACPSEYVRMARQAREDYRQRLNWDSFGKQLNNALVAII
jgi:glycosyltransferase involved in cell wall biosynthesis